MVFEEEVALCPLSVGQEGGPGRDCLGGCPPALKQHRPSLLLGAWQPDLPYPFEVPVMYNFVLLSDLMEKSRGQHREFLGCFLFRCPKWRHLNS